jgi:hypothetical protein
LTGSGSADNESLVQEGKKIVLSREGTSAVFVSKKGAVTSGKDYLIDQRIVIKKVPFTRNNENASSDEVHANFPVGTELRVGGRIVSVTHQDHRMGPKVARIIGKERSTREVSGLFVRTTQKESAKMSAKIVRKAH